mmetsp:Transcript_34520/g.81846  ORF Transcript_34520/g.81846 Transcript_34520/m.81846 type:complete len:204 (-) Transcript_34520:602-1213(-)
MRSSRASPSSRQSLHWQGAANLSSAQHTLQQGKMPPSVQSAQTQRRLPALWPQTAMCGHAERSGTTTGGSTRSAMPSLLASWSGTPTTWTVCRCISRALFCLGRRTSSSSERTGLSTSIRTKRSRGLQLGATTRVRGSMTLPNGTSASAPPSTRGLRADGLPLATPSPLLTKGTRPCPHTGRRRGCSQGCTSPSSASGWSTSG